MHLLGETSSHSTGGGATASTSLWNATTAAIKLLQHQRPGEGGLGPLNDQDE
ncbi:unnamed protein product, partial [Amoebophrya sp. A25]